MHYNCLIVDDEVELAKMTAEYFQMFDISTEYVDSAAACYAFLEKTFQVLLLVIYSMILRQNNFMKRQQQVHIMKDLRLMKNYMVLKIYILKQVALSQELTMD